jgi:tryptophan-rich sensory protein
VFGYNGKPSATQDSATPRVPAAASPADSRSRSRVASTVALLAFVLLTIGAGATVGMLFPPDEWFESLAKPTWNPPGWLFGPVWTTLYVMIGLSAWLVWREPRVSESERRVAWGLFALQAVLNLGWTPLFFGLHRPGLAFLDISLLWLTLIWMTLRFGKIKPLAGYLLVPYVLWVSFALVLNGTIWLMNH